MEIEFNLKGISKGEIFACDWVEFVVENDNRTQCFDFARFCGLGESVKNNIKFGVNFGLTGYTFTAFEKLIRKGDLDIFKLSDIVEGIEPEKNHNPAFITTLRIKKYPHKQPHKHKVGDEIACNGEDCYVDSLSHAAFNGKAMYNLSSLDNPDINCTVTEERLLKDQDYLYNILDKIINE